MKLYTYCTKCKSEIGFNLRAKDRFTLAKKHGEEIQLTCNNCSSRKYYHVNDIKAEESKAVGMVSLFSFLTGTAVIFILLWPYFLGLPTYMRFQDWLQF